MKKKKGHLPSFGVRVVSFTFCVTFVLSLFLVFEGGLYFWLSFGMFVATAVYVSKHEERLLRELDEWFGETNDGFGFFD